MALPQPPMPQTMTCYRHPGREAWRRCTRCGRPACNECLVQATVGSHCVECAKAARPNMATRARFWNARQPTLMTYAVMAINIAIFVWLAVENRDNITGSGPITGVPDGEVGQFDLGLIKPFVADGEWYRVLTSGFLHFGVLHLALNMLLLFQLGQLLEPAIGRVRFTLVYFAALLGGSAGALLLQGNNEVGGGASGAVFGLLGAAFIGLRQRGINPFSTGIGTTLLLNVVITFSISGISIGAHIGGLVAGAIAGWVVLAPGHRGIPTWATYAAPVAVMAVALLVSYAAVQS